MKIGNFLFPESAGPETDAARVHETIAEARRSEALGMDALWLAEHHFDGNCVYVDPITFAATLAGATSRIGMGFAVLQTSLYHPMRMAEQLSLLDIVCQGRLMVGLGRGTNGNIYEYQGYGIDPAEAQGRYDEATAILEAAWSTEGPISFKGKYWDIKAPALRPRPLTRPAPPIVHGASGEASMVERAKRGEPFLMNVQTIETTRARFDLYVRTMREAGFDEDRIRDNLSKCWVWRNVFVADTDEEAEAVGVPIFGQMVENRAAMRKRTYAEQGLVLTDTRNEGAPRSIDVDKALTRGSPATVSREFEALAEIGVGGVICAFRMGPMSYDVADRSMTAFMEKVAPGVTA